MRHLVRVLALVGALLFGWLIAATADPASASSVGRGSVYTYDLHLGPTCIEEVASERGPPSSGIGFGEADGADASTVARLCDLAIAVLGQSANVDSGPR